jgi:pyruvate ferredoxin oxidoreductase gamma subunit
MTPIDLQGMIRDAVLEIRGDGKAGGGLVLAFQSLANLCMQDAGIQVQEWPFFSSARRGASIRSFLRVSRKPIQVGCEITRPMLSVLMNESTAHTVDFAEGVPRGGSFVLNTRHSPEECARYFRLSGRVFTVPGDDIGRTYLKHPIGNVSVYAAAARAIGGFEKKDIVESFLNTLKKRHVPEAVLERNRQALTASMDAVRECLCDEAVSGEHESSSWSGYGDLPVGAQTALRLSRANATAGFAPSGSRLQFDDPDHKCNGCAHCITNCPEGVIQFHSDEQTGVVVTGAEVNQYCKLCGECIAVCPEHLFRKVEFEERWEGANTQ